MFYTKDKGGEAVVEEQGRGKRLLNDMADRLGCMYLSNLHEDRWQALLFVVIEHMKPEEYDADMWNEAVRYIVDKPVEFDSAKEAFEYLVEYSKMICIRNNKKDKRKIRPG